MENQTRTVEVKTGGGYPVVIGGDLLKAAGPIILERKKPCRVAVIADTNTERLFGAEVAGSLEASGFSAGFYSVSPGEGTKNLGSLEGILEFMAGQGLDRGDLLVALGGGVVGDLAGFAAAVYLRGIDCVQMPTTFLAAIDSSVGGKTAVNLSGGKNLAGVFHQPLAVICSCNAFQSLSPQVFSEGAAEAVKYGVLAGGRLFSLLLAGRGGQAGLFQAALVDVVEQCVRIKAAFVERDPFDRGQRRLLNLGHTIGHSAEKCSGYTIPHGQAVAIGLAIITRAAERAGLAEAGTEAALCQALERQRLPVETDISSRDLYEGALKDKKKQGNKIQLILPRKIGHCEIREVSLEELRRLIELGRER